MFSYGVSCHVGWTVCVSDLQIHLLIATTKTHQANAESLTPHLCKELEKYLVSTFWSKHVTMPSIYIGNCWAKFGRKHQNLSLDVFYFDYNLNWTKRFSSRQLYWVVLALRTVHLSPKEASTATNNLLKEMKMSETRKYHLFFFYYYAQYDTVFQCHKCLCISHLLRSAEIFSHRNCGKLKTKTTFEQKLYNFSQNCRWVVNAMMFVFLAKLCSQNSLEMSTFPPISTDLTLLHLWQKNRLCVLLCV